MTIAGLLPSYLDKPHKRTGRPRKSTEEIQRRFERNIIPVVGAMRLTELHRRDVNRVVATIAKRAPTEATRVFEDLRAMMRWALGQGYLDRNPLEGMDPPARSGSRERMLDEGEIRMLWNALPTSLARSPTCQEILRLCLITGQRVGEIAGMQRRELDLANAIWRIPAARSKNGHEHAVPLSPLAIKVIDRALTITREDAEFVFPDTNGGSLPAAAVARTVSRAHEGKSPSRFGIPHWTAHDLRRTVVSQMAKLGVPPIVLGHIINHRSVTKAGVTLSVYQQYDYEKEKRQALDLWANKLMAIVHE